MVAGGRKARRLVTAIVVVAGIGLTVGAALAAGPLGVLTQLSGTAGCFTYNGASAAGASTCSQARGLARGESAIVSPDSANVYVGSYANLGASVGPGYAVFSRNTSTGALTQLAGTAGCLTTDGSSSAGPGTCTKARGLISAAGDGHDFAFTSDARWAYVVAQNRDPSGTGAIMIFQRDPASGALTQLPGTAGCISSDGSDQDGAGQCQKDATLSQPDQVTISSDDRFLYVEDYFGPNRLHVFSRNTTTGALTEVQCISEAPAPAGCSTGRVLGDSEYLALSRDGMHAYDADYNYGLSVFDRDPSTGLLTQKAGTAGCITNNGNDNTGASTCAVGRQADGNYPILIAPNGATLYNVDGNQGGLSVFHINADGTLTQLSGTAGCVTINGKDTTGASTCAVGRAVNSLYGGALSPDGNTLYLSSNTQGGGGGVALFSLNQTSGAATQLSGLQGCITADGSSNGTAGQCAVGRALSEGYGMSVSLDGSSVYQATEDSSNAGLAVYRADTAPVCQPASVNTAFATPVSVSLKCADADGDPASRSIVSGPAHGTLSAIDNTAGTVTYTPAAGFSGTDSFTFAASDGVNGSAPVTATIAVAAAPPPALTNLTITPSAFFAAAFGPSITSVGYGATVSYRDSRAATTTLTVLQAQPGVKSRGKCVAPPRRPSKHKLTHCTRTVGLGHFTHSDVAGVNRFRFTGSVGGRALKPGRYTLGATASVGALNSRPVQASFRINKHKRR
jgi:6-phosphogluconolactonase (cycloisomerase 2 family)